MKLTFDNRVAVVTGAGRGIGKAIAESLASAGVTVLCVSKNPESCGAVAEAILAAGGKAKAYPADVANGEAVTAATAQMLKDFGKVDILINNAGITKDGLLFMMKEEDWQNVLQTNLTSCFHWCKALGRPMTRARWGRIVNISSVSGIMGNAGQANYAAAKAGMIGLTKSLAKEFAGRSVTVNCVAPGFIETDMTSGLDGKITDAVKQVIPLARFCTAAEVAPLVTFLCSGEASYITGQVFAVDGGLAM